jgi:hypothetical protein
LWVFIRFIARVVSADLESYTAIVTDMKVTEEIEHLAKNMRVIVLV